MNHTVACPREDSADEMRVGVGHRTHTLSLKHVSDNLLCAMRITLSTEKELDQLCPKSFHWNDGCEVRRMEALDSI